MKKSIQLLVFIFAIVMCTQATFAQDCTSVNTSRDIELDGSSEREEIKLNVDADVKQLHLFINSTISTGFLTVEIYDPKGKKRGYYTVESQTKSNAKKKETVCGQLQKQISDPMKGDWVVRLIPKNVKGKISIHSGQVQEKS
ncbi:MAG: hypothetical protein DWP94_14580 [Flavobacterium sp.]|nr:MAG: hypothetical protein DWP94_14580 [Flavobacterium sp.]